MKPIRWPCDFNRPLSKEEREIAARLNRLTHDQLVELDRDRKLAEWRARQQEAVE